MLVSNACSNRNMSVQRPGWWCRSERCANGHEWGPGLIMVSWSLCDARPRSRRAAAGTGAYGSALRRLAWLPVDVVPPAARAVLTTR
jgi:hypothetical protein